MIDRIYSPLKFIKHIYVLNKDFVLDKNFITVLETTEDDVATNDESTNPASISCMNGDVVEMTANINESDVQNDLTQEGWSLGMV